VAANATLARRRRNHSDAEERRQEGTRSTLRSRYSTGCATASALVLPAPVNAAL
jgi:hypothetical protein